MTGAEFLDVLEHEPASGAALAAVSNALERCQYTTVALRAIASWLEANEDVAGARLVAGFAETFAEHEASTL